MVKVGGSRSGSRLGSRAVEGSRSGSKAGSWSGEGQGPGVKGGGHGRRVLGWSQGQSGLEGGGVEMKRKCS